MSGPSPEHLDARPGGASRITALILFAAVVAYLAALPPNLGMADESYFLIEAKRITEGQVLYRDLFWIAMPTAHWMMALVLWAFGGTLQVARFAMAVLHGLTAVVLFLTCRRLGVRTGLALAVPVAYVALCHATWPYASPHWVSTFWMVVLLWVLLGQRWAASPAGAVIPGLVTGALAAVHHHQGAVFALGVTLLFALDRRLGTRFGARPADSPPLPRLLAFAGGVALVMGPTLGAAVATAGLATLVEQIILQPLGGYRRWNQGVAWGDVNFMIAPLAAYTQPWLLKYLPVALAIDLVRLVVDWVTRRHHEEFRSLLVLVVLGTSAVVSIAYLPDIIHVAFIAPLLLVPAAEILERATEHVPRIVGTALAAVLLSALALQLAGNLTRARREFPLEHATPFGRVAFATPEQIAFADRVRDLIRETPGRPLFVHPAFAQFYLTTGATNPTRHILVLPGYLTDDEMKRQLAALEAQPLPYVVMCDFATLPGDPVRAWIRARYAPLPDPAASVSGCTVYAAIAGPGR